ncbi:MAG: hypothetical protein CSA86_01740 [Arcobacter sp.]|nr:MAG: hypothetical protein CSA86_01740 [Arcobacter sp.]
MTMIYNKKAKKKNTNLSINSDLLSKAREYKINLSSSLEKTLEDEVRTKEKEKWKNSNKDAINSYNQRIKENGLFNDSFRSF